MYELIALLFFIFLIILFFIITVSRNKNNVKLFIKSKYPNYTIKEIKFNLIESILLRSFNYYSTISINDEYGEKENVLLFTTNIIGDVYIDE
jgi:hypothetical protein